MIAKLLIGKKKVLDSCTHFMAQACSPDATSTARSEQASPMRMRLELIFREQAEEERREKAPCHFCKEGHSRGA
jgi:hypothetical protein